jgi:F0F1-type ATP synthase assembly protein I
MILNSPSTRVNQIFLHSPRNLFSSAKTDNLGGLCRAIPDFVKLSTNSVDAAREVSRITPPDQGVTMATSNRPGQEPTPSDGQFRLIGQALSLGWELVVPTLVGWFLDRQFGWSPAGVMIGGALGFVLVIIHALRLTPSDKPPRQPPSENPAS